MAGTVLGAALCFSPRSDLVSVLRSYYYDDGCESCGTDTFSREPFIVEFSSPTTRKQSWHMAASQMVWGAARTWHGVPSTRG